MRCECGRLATFRSSKSKRWAADAEHTLCWACYRRLLAKKQSPSVQIKTLNSVVPKFEAFTVNSETVKAQIRALVRVYLPVRRQIGAITQGNIQRELCDALGDVSADTQTMSALCARILNKLFMLTEEYAGREEEIIAALYQELLSLIEGVNPKKGLKRGMSS